MPPKSIPVALQIYGEVTHELIAPVYAGLLAVHNDPSDKREVHLHICSPGGDAQAGYGLIALIQHCKNRVVTFGVGAIESMGANIFVAGHHRVLPAQTTMMIHWGSVEIPPSITTPGALKAQARMFDMEQRREIAHYMACSRYKTEAAVREHLLPDYDNWLTAQEALSHGLCDELLT